MSYQLTEDITVDREFNADDLDVAMQLCINRISAAFSKLDNHSSTFGSLMDSIFQSFVHTQKSIRLLLKETKDDLKFASDAMSLVREQIEKIYVVALILDNPSKWIELYFKDDWRRLYKHEVLLNTEERKNLQRFQEHNKVTEETYDKWRLAMKVSDHEKELIIHRHDNPGVAKPVHLTSVDLPVFPTPGQVPEKIADVKLKDFLLRWHKEYEFICGYNHVGLEKLFVGSLIQAKGISDEDKRTAVEKEIIIPAAILSYLAMASACSIAWKYLIKHDNSLKNSTDFLDAIMKFWDEMKELSLLGKVFWAIYVKDVFPKIITF